MERAFDRGFVLPLRPRPQHGDAPGATHSLWVAKEDVAAANLELLKGTLRAEASPVKYWIMLAFAYRNAGDLDAFESLLKDAEAQLDVAGRADDECSRGAIYAALATHHFTQSEQFAHDEKRHARHGDFASHYMSRSESSGHYTWHIAMGQHHLARFLQSRQHEERARAKECFHVAMLVRPHSVVAVVYYANVFVLENQFQLAAVFYMRALLLCSHLEIMLKVRREFGPAAAAGVEGELEHAALQLTHMRALLMFALAACKFNDGDTRAAKALVEGSLRVAKTPLALRLKAAIAATYIVDHAPEYAGDSSDAEGHAAPRDSVAALVAQWSEAAREAYTLDPSSVTGQLHLCELLFHHGRVEECEAKLAEVKRHGVPPNLQAELLYQTARCAHARGDVHRAYAGYSSVLALRADFVPARLQVIKTAIASSNLGAAREQCEYLSQHGEKVLEVLRLVGLVYLASARETVDACRAKVLQTEAGASDIDVSCAVNSMQQDVGRLVDERLFKAMGILEEALALDPDDRQSVEYAIYTLELLVSRGRESLLPKLREAYVRYMKMPDARPSFEMRNNDAVVALRFREFADALDKLGALWDLVAEDPAVAEPAKVVLQFNLAVAHEESGNASKAYKMYTQLTHEYPRYIVPWIRKSNMAFARGDLENAQRYLEQLKAWHKRSVDPWLCKAHQLLTAGRLDEAIEEMRRLFRTISTANFDAYANTLFACALVRRGSRGGFAQLPKEVLHYARAGLRRPALCNFYAANCLAIYLAHEGHLRMAYESFGVLLESLASTSRMRFVAHRNMGLFCAATALGNERRLERGSYDKLRASKAQQHLLAALAQDKLDAGTHLVYARFLYDSQRLDECAHFLEGCRRLFPRDLKFVYNMVVAVDAAICKHMRNSDKLASATEVAKMLTQAYFVKSATAHLLAVHSRYPKMSASHLQQIAARAKDKLIPHMEGALPQLEAAAVAKQRTKGKHLELQMSIQQAHEAKRLELELERQRVAEAEQALSEQLLKEASEIASELMYSRPPGQAQTGAGR